MLAILSILASFLTAWPATAQVDPNAKWYDCLHQHVRSLDDKISDARSIASGVIAACSNVRQELLLEQTASSWPDRRERARHVADIVKQLRERDIDGATFMVLQERAKRR